MSVGISLGLRAVWTVRLCCVRRLRSSPRLCCSARVCSASTLRVSSRPGLVNLTSGESAKVGSPAVSVGLLFR
jgi:hypothetical protein